MTILVGVSCSDGVVIGTDSAMTSASGAQPVAETTGATKIHLRDDMIVATAGGVGMRQRLMHEITTLATNTQQYNQVKRRGPVVFASKISEVANINFRATLSPAQQHPNIGWGFGALIAFGLGEEATLAEFDTVHFGPEIHGHESKCLNYGTMGIGQPMGQPFLAHAHRVLCNDEIPSLAMGRLLVAWTLAHVIRHNVGGVGGDPQIAVLKHSDGNWVTEEVDPGEAQQQVQDLETFMGTYGDITPADDAGTVEEVMNPDA